MKQNIDFKKTFLLSMITSLGISALIGIIIFLFGEFGSLELKLLATTLAIAGYSLTGLCCSVLYEKKKFFPFALFGMFTSVLGFIFAALQIWEALPTYKAFESEVTLMILAFSTAHASLLLTIKSEKKLVNIFLSATITFIFIVALMLINITTNNYYNISEFYYRLLGVFSILDVLGTIVVPILNKIYS